MKNKDLHFIINPKSSGGNSGSDWEKFKSEIQSHIGKFEYTFTDAPGAATRITYEILKSKPKIIAVVGGDGTISEVVSGFFQKSANQSEFQSKNNHKTSIVVINRGTGGDFCRTLGAPSDLKLALQQIKQGREVKVDIGHVSYIQKDKSKSGRFFINVAGCGMAGEVVEAINKSKKRFGSFSYFLTSSQVLWKYKNKNIKLTLDDGEPVTKKVVTVAVCNGQFFGGGMQIGPEAMLTDGIFDVVTIGNWNKIQSLWNSRKLYNGSIASVKHVEVVRAKKILIEPVETDDAVKLDCDGEDVGIAPVEIRILPKAVTFLV